VFDLGELRADVLVLGAGMVGVGIALHLQKRGRDVILVDRHELAGEETSYGNTVPGNSAKSFIMRPTAPRRSTTAFGTCRRSCRGCSAIIWRPGRTERCAARWQ
jgi:glycine/D-amino acid oxidase-like deaminating enzyme